MPGADAIEPPTPMQLPRRERPMPAAGVIEPPTPMHQTRRERPRSLSDSPALRSVPAPLACEWHGHGNVDREQLRTLNLASFEHITHPDSRA